MKHFWLVIVLTITVFSCDSKKSKTVLYDYVPDNAAVVFNINAVESLKSNLSNNDFIGGLETTKLYQSISKKLNLLDYIETEQPIVLSFYKDAQDSLQFTCATKQIPNLFNIDSLDTVKAETLTIGLFPAKKIDYKKETIYAAFKDSIAVIASNDTALQALLSEKQQPNAFKSQFNIIDKEKPVSIIINSNTDSSFKTLFAAETLPLKDFTDITLFDADISKDEIILSGITQAKDSTESLINIFKNTIPQENLLAQIAPNSCDSFLSFTFNDFSIFNAQLKAFRKDETSTNTQLFDNIIEVGTITLNKTKAIALQSIDIIATKDALLSEQTKAGTYRNVTLYNFGQPTLFKTVFAPLITDDSLNYYCILDQFIVFGNTKSDLENIIANHQNETTLSTRSYYNAIANNLSSEASILQIVKPNVLKSVLEKNLDSDLKPSFKNYKISASQYIYDTNYAHFNAIVKRDKAKVESKTVTEVLNTKLDASILTDPQFVINHRTKQKEIVVQDINNVLYLISNTGKILWKKQLKGPILGDIKQIDVYKNRRLQLAFATPSRVYVIARNGKHVDGFPLKFNDKITQPLSVFDYDKKRDYRLFVTQDKDLLLYNAKGKTVKGFNFKGTKETINTQPKHIRIREKDYIAVKTNKNLHILSRTGKTRVKPNKRLDYANEPVFYYDKGFATVAKDGSLVKISQSGKVTTSELLGENTKLYTTVKTLVAQNENKLKIKGKTIELNFGHYTRPKLFYLKDKIYVSVTDLQSQKVLLFDSKAQSIPNFPVYGNSSIELNNIDRDRALEFVTKSEDNAVIVYKIN